MQTRDRTGHLKIKTKHGLGAVDKEYLRGKEGKLFPNLKIKTKFFRPQVRLNRRREINRKMQKWGSLLKKFLRKRKLILGFFKIAQTTLFTRMWFYQTNQEKTKLKRAVLASLRSIRLWKTMLMSWKAQSKRDPTLRLSDTVEKKLTF